MPQKYSKPFYPKHIPWWAYDIAIVIGLLLSLWLGMMVHGIFWVGFAVLVYGSFVESRLLTVKRYVVGKTQKNRVGDMHRPVHIAYLSDLHVGPYKKQRWLRRVVKKTNELRPDLILLGGDYLYSDAREAAELGPLKDLRAAGGVYAILGNHDTYYGLGEAEGALKKAGVHVLRNASARIEHEGKMISIVGVDDDWYAETEFEEALKDVAEGEPVIMMIHNVDLAPHAADILSSSGLAKRSMLLAGHAHGGQIRLPFIGPVPPLPQKLGRKYDRGRFNFKGVPLILGQGLGESGPRARLFCPPQIIVVELCL